ncbi:MAG: metal-dependent transcriptional regulator [bacterium]
MGSEAMNVMNQQVVNDSTYWRAFEENELTHSVAHYLMAVDNLRAEYGYARVTDVANFLNISRGAASLAISQLKDRGLIKEDPNRFLLLTEEGQRLAHTVEHNFFLLTCFFENVLGVPAETARADACKMEHLLSDHSSKALVKFLQVLFSNRKWVRELTEAVKNAGDLCECKGACPLCETIGECLMPESVSANCPLRVAK